MYPNGMHPQIKSPPLITLVYNFTTYSSSSSHRSNDAVYIYSVCIHIVHIYVYIPVYEQIKLRPCGCSSGSSE